MLPLSTWKPTPFPSPWEKTRDREGQPAGVAGLGLFWEQKQPPPPPQPTRGALGGSAASLSQAVRALGSGSPSRNRSSGFLALGRRAWPALEGAELWPRVRWHPRECECNDVSARFSCTTGNALGLPPSYPEKVGLAFLGSRRSAGPDLVSEPPRRLALPAPRFGSAGTGRRARWHRGGCTHFAVAHLSELARGRHCAERTGMSLALGRSHHLHNRTPGQVGQKHWRAPEIGANSAE